MFGESRTSYIAIIEDKIEPFGKNLPISLIIFIAVDQSGNMKFEKNNSQITVTSEWNFQIELYFKIWF